MAVERWEIDSGHSGIYFAIRHMGLARVRGQFSRWSGRLIDETGDLRASVIDILIDATSITTGLEERDNHLRSADFLDTARFPEITYRGRVSGRPRGGKLRITGELTALGIPHPLPFLLENTGRTIDPWGRERASFTAQGALDRRDLGVRWNQALGPSRFLVAPQVAFEIEVEAVLQEEPGQARSVRLPSRPGWRSVQPSDPAAAPAAGFLGQDSGAVPE